MVWSVCTCLQTDDMGFGSMCCIHQKDSEVIENIEHESQQSNPIFGARLVL